MNLREINTKVVAFRHSLQRVCIDESVPADVILGNLQKLIEDLQLLGHDINSVKHWKEHGDSDVLYR